MFNHPMGESLATMAMAVALWRHDRRRDHGREPAHRTHAADAPPRGQKSRTLRTDPTQEVVATATRPT